MSIFEEPMVIDYDRFRKSLLKKFAVRSIFSKTSCEKETFQSRCLLEESYSDSLILDSDDKRVPLVEDVMIRLIMKGNSVAPKCSFTMIPVILTQKLRIIHKFTAD